MITVDEFKKVLPKNAKDSVTQELIDKINLMLNDTELSQNYRDNLLGFTSVMADGKYKIDDYLNAVKYVSYKLLGDSNVTAYVKTFPDRYNKLVSEGKDSKTISSYVSAYNSNKLVSSIYEQSMIPTWLLNAENFQKAINVQVDLMLNAQSEKVRCDAADSVLTHLKRPEATKVELSIGVKENSVISELEATTRALVEQQRAMLESGRMTANDIALAPIVINSDSEVIDVQ